MRGSRFGPQRKLTPQHFDRAPHDHGDYAPAIHTHPEFSARHSHPENAPAAHDHGGHLKADGSVQLAGVLYMANGATIAPAEQFGSGLGSSTLPFSEVNAYRLFGTEVRADQSRIAGDG